MKKERMSHRVATILRQLNPGQGLATNATASYGADAVMGEIKTQFEANKDKVNTDLDAIFEFKISNGSDNISWTIDLKGKSIYRGSSGKAGCTFSMADKDFVALFKKEADPMQLFMEQRLQMDGDMGLAMQFQSVLEAVEGK